MSLANLVPWICAGSRTSFNQWKVTEVAKCWFPDWTPRRPRSLSPVMCSWAPGPPHKKYGSLLDSPMVSPGTAWQEISPAPVFSPAELGLWPVLSQPLAPGIAAHQTLKPHAPLASSPIWISAFTSSVLTRLMSQLCICCSGPWQEQPPTPAPAPAFLEQNRVQIFYIQSRHSQNRWLTLEHKEPLLTQGKRVITEINHEQVCPTAIT